jgi:hypothetical protein
MLLSVVLCNVDWISQEARNGSLGSDRRSTGAGLAVHDTQCFANLALYDGATAVA